MGPIRWTSQASERVVTTTVTETAAETCGRLRVRTPGKSSRAPRHASLCHGPDPPRGPEGSGHFCSRRSLVLGACRVPGKLRAQGWAGAGTRPGPRPPFAVGKVSRECQLVQGAVVDSAGGAEEGQRGEAGVQVTVRAGPASLAGPLRPESRQPAFPLAGQLPPWLPRLCPQLPTDLPWAGSPGPEPRSPHLQKAG